MATMISQRSMGNAAGGAGFAGQADAPKSEEKLPLAQSAMLVVLGSSGCWFMLASFTRWLLS